MAARPDTPARRRVAARPLPTGGRQRLIEAALRLAARHGGMSAVGVRELAREAGLNPNTLYRHFGDVADVGVAAVETVVPPLRAGLRSLRTGARSVGQAVAQGVRFFFQFVEREPDAITFAARELYGSSPKLRTALREAVRGLTDDVLEVMSVDGALPMPADAARELADTIVKQMFELALEYVAWPEQRAALVARGERFVLMLFVGSYLCRTMKLTLDSPMLDQVLGAAAGRAAPPPLRALQGGKA